MHANSYIDHTNGNQYVKV